MRTNNKTGAIMVIGGGIGGVQASLDLAKAGFRVYLVEKEPTIGGMMARLDKTFPTNDCSICILSPKLNECERDINIDIITMAELIDLEGEPGEFKATVKKRPRYIDEEKCNNCQMCINYCPTIIPDSYNENFSTTKCLHLVTPQAVPAIPFIDPNHCLFLNERMCKICAPVCKYEAIDLYQEEKEIALDVGAIILAMGSKCFDPSVYKNYGYSEFKNVVTSMEFERILNASGPYEGHLLRPSDKTEPKKIAWLQCVGSRDINRGHGYCSSVCCMYAIKQAFIAREHSSKPLDTAIFFMDMRTAGKDFDAYFERAKSEGIRFIRSRIHTIFPADESGDLLIRYIDENGKFKEEKFDMIVLSVGLEPKSDAINLAKKLGIKLNENNFIENTSFEPVKTSRPGIYVCGTLNGPKDIPSTVAEASAAACEAATLLAPSRGRLVRVKEVVPEKDVSGLPPRIGVFICHCGTNIAGVLSIKELVEDAKKLPNVVFAMDNLYTCSTDTQEVIKEKIKEYDLNRVVVASCTPRTHQPLFQETLREAGLNPYLFEMVNIREHCSWVHRKAPEMATEKAKALIRMGVAKAGLLRPLKPLSIDITKAALVIGGGVAGLVSSLMIADQGFKVYLVERKDRLGGNALRFHDTWRGEDVTAYVNGLIEKVNGHPLIEVFLNAEVLNAEGFVGNFETTLMVKEKEMKIRHGVVIIATGADPYKPKEYLYGEHKDVLISLEFDDELSKRTERIKNAKKVVFIQCAGSRTKERPYCSKVCCTHSIYGALKLKEINPDIDVYILYREIRTYGERERLYREARKKGIFFIRYSLNDKPKVESINGKLKVVVKDHVLGIPIEIHPDFIVLASGIMVKRENVEKLAKLYKCTLDDQSFFREAHVKLRPVESSTDGIYIAGLAHYPKPIDETITQAKATAMKAAELLSKEKMIGEAAIAFVNKDLCIGCGICTDLCPFHAVKLEREGKKMKASVISASCKGCGICAVHCPTGAIDVSYFTNSQIKAQIETFGVKDGI